MTDRGWPTGRQRDGGIDRISLPPGVAGELRLSGKHAIGAGRFADPAAPWSTILCLCERFELAPRYPAYVDWLDRSSQEQALWHPIPDLHAPTLDDMTAVVRELADRVREGGSLLVHCAAGMGRTGMTAVCLLVTLGLDGSEALERVDRERPGAGPQTIEQEELVREFVAAERMER